MSKDKNILSSIASKGKDKAAVDRVAKMLVRLHANRYRAIRAKAVKEGIAASEAEFDKEIDKLFDQETT